MTSPNYHSYPPTKRAHFISTDRNVLGSESERNLLIFLDRMGVSPTKNGEQVQFNYEGRAVTLYAHEKGTALEMEPHDTKLSDSLSRLLHNLIQSGFADPRGKHIQAAEAVVDLDSLTDGTEMPDKPTEKSSFLTYFSWRKK